MAEAVRYIGESLRNVKGWIDADLAKDHNEDGTAVKPHVKQMLTKMSEVMTPADGEMEHYVFTWSRGTVVKAM